MFNKKDKASNMLKDIFDKIKDKHEDDALLDEWVEDYNETMFELYLLDMYPGQWVDEC